MAKNTKSPTHRLPGFSVSTRFCEAVLFPQSRAYIGKSNPHFQVSPKSSLQSCSSLSCRIYLSNLPQHVRRTSPSRHRKVITLKVLVDKAKNRVIFAEADYEFVDILLSFLTLPIGTVVRLLGPDSTSIGSLTAMYNSVSSLESRHLRTDYCKEMLLNPRNALETECSKLKINVYPLEPVNFYTCSGCPWHLDRWLSTFKDRECRCKYRMSKLMKVEEDKAIGGGGGVFVKDVAARFMITDDLQ